MDTAQIADGFRNVLARIGKASLQAQRDENDVKLVVASKTQPADCIRPLLASGHKLFGENRVQEAMDKWPALKEEFADVELHLIGPLQTNKVRAAVALFDMIETVDREKLAVALAKEAESQGKSLRVLVEVNTGEESQKAGVHPAAADAFIRFCIDELKLRVEGLMCVPPANHQAAPHFALLAQIARRHGLQTLSMGMTADFPIAIQLGATHVRVGTAIFGERV